MGEADQQESWREHRGAMEPAAGPVLYQKLALWDPSLGSEEEEETETLELVIPNSWSPQDSLR